MKTAIVFLLSLCIAVPLMAQPPVNGTYTSTDLGGLMLTGRYSESWFGGPLQVNNTLNEESWDGATLGTQWRWYCPWILSPPTLLSNTVNGNGDGFKTWNVTYSDGICWLDGSGPWGGGDASYTANITTWSVQVTEQYANNVLIASIRNTFATAQFQGYNSECMDLQISNNEMIGNTDSGAKPGDYPEFWYWNPCGSIGNAGPGEWGTVTDITFIIDGCITIPVEEKTWGSVKAMYQE